MAAFGAKRSLRLAVRPTFFGLDLAQTFGPRELNVFNWLEDGVCTMCVSRDQRKSGDDQFEQLEVNKPQHQRRADISGGQIKRSLLFTADVEP